METSTFREFSKRANDEEHPRGPSHSARPPIAAKTKILGALLRHNSRDVNFKQHPGNGESGDDEERIGRDRAAFAVFLAPAIWRIVKRAEVSYFQRTMEAAPDDQPDPQM
jgi:hypothetical protein